jgi:hypothetical protein
MEITYDDIIKYLVPNSKKKFASENNISIILNSEIYFKNILNNQFYRLGVLQNNFQNLNISFFVAFLTLTVKTFQQNTNEEKISIVKQFKLFINEQIIELNLCLGEEPVKKINLDYVDNNIIELIAKIFDINILIFDFKNETSILVSADTICNVYKPFILLANFDEQYEPILYKNRKTLSYNDEYFKNMLDNINKTKNINNDIKNIIQELNNNNKLINDTFIKNIDIEIKKVDNVLTLSQINKMKKEEIINLLKKQGVDIETNTKLLKKDLIKLIK